MAKILSPIQSCIYRNLARNVYKTSKEESNHIPQSLTTGGCYCWVSIPFTAQKALLPYTPDEMASGHEWIETLGYPSFQNPVSFWYPFFFHDHVKQPFFAPIRPVYVSGRPSSRFWSMRGNKWQTTCFLQPPVRGVWSEQSREGSSGRYYRENAPIAMQVIAQWMRLHSFFKKGSVGKK